MRAKAWDAAGMTERPPRFAPLKQGVIDLIAVSGYYDVVSMTLNVAEVALPDGLPPPLKPLAR